MAEQRESILTKEQIAKLVNWNYHSISIGGVYSNVSVANAEEVRNNAVDRLNIFVRVASGVDAFTNPELFYDRQGKTFSEERVNANFEKYLTTHPQVAQQVMSALTGGLLSTGFANNYEQAVQFLPRVPQQDKSAVPSV